MSLYFGFHYKGIIKEKYRKDMAAAFDKGCWSAVIDNELKRMIYALYPYGKEDYYPEEETEFMEDLTCFGGYCDSPDYLADFDKRSGLLVFFREWNHHHMSMDEAMRGIEDVILPFITESVILYETWTEPMSDDDADEWIPDKGGFEAGMKYINELYETKGIDAVLEELPHGGL